MYHRRLVTPPLANGDERPILTRSAVQASTTQPEDEVGTVIRSVRPRLCAIALSALAVAPLTHLSAQKPPAATSAPAIRIPFEKYVMPNDRTVVPSDDHALPTDSVHA